MEQDEKFPQTKIKELQREIKGLKTSRLVLFFIGFALGFMIALNI